MNTSLISFSLKAVFAAMLAACACAIVSAPAGASPVLTTIHSFAVLTSGMNADGAYPLFGALVQWSDGSFYGTASEGGAHGTGAVYKVTSSGVFTTLYSFSASTSSTFPILNSDGADPAAGLVLGRDGDFYGTTELGGPSGSGTVFKITPQGALTTLYAFSAISSQSINSDGASPAATLVQGVDGDFYGTAISGGSGGSGTVFKITPAGAFTTLHAFSSISRTSINSDGANPFAALVQGGDGSFYGTTQAGGTQGNGAVFQITQTGTFTTLVSFSGATGTYPIAGLVLGGDGNFYGTTGFGGASGDGTIFQMTPAGALTVLADFNGTNGNGSDAGLTLGNDGNFYGTTQFGGIHDAGTTFQVTPTGGLTTLISFDGTDGDQPLGALIEGADGSLYGTTYGGGSGSGDGTVFRLNLAPNPPAITTFSPARGPVGTVVTLIGNNFNGVSAVRFHDQSAKIFSSSVDGTQLSVTVPDGAATGTITVTTPGGSATTATPFRVTYAPVIASFSPASGPAGTVVTIVGTHLTGITRVRFHDADASVYSSNAAGTQLTVTVPAGAKTGTITLDNRDALATTSTGAFMVTP